MFFSTRTKFEQHAIITSFETYHHQFQILREAHDFFSSQIVSRSRRYMYSRFEFELFCQFFSITINRANLIFELFANDTKSKSSLICNFCIFALVKSFASIAKLWDHIVNKHQEIDNDFRLEKILHNASLWRKYWDFHSLDDKRHHIVLIKLNQTQQQYFCWKDVMKWFLRWNKYYDRAIKLI